MSNSNMETSLC